MQASFIRRFDKGAYVFRAGDPVEEFYVITKGSCEVITPSSEKAGRVIATLGAGDFFGETVRPPACSRPPRPPTGQPALIASALLSRPVCSERRPRSSALAPTLVRYAAGRRWPRLAGATRGA